MKNIFIISCSYDASQLNNYLDSLSNTKKLFDNTWLIADDTTAQSLYDKLEPYIDKSSSNRILVVKLTKERHGWHSKSVWEWLKENESE